jgi:hypothetical protein
VSSNDRPQPIAPTALLAAARRLLRPLVHLMLRSGVTYPMLADALRHLFVDVAVTDFLAQPAARTDSRISLLTGIHRKLVRQYRTTEFSTSATPEAVSVGSQIIARWLGSPPYADEAGRPRPLPRIGRGDAMEPSFEALVSSVTTDIHPRAVLDDWLSQGLVQVAADDRVVLNAEAFIPRPGGAAQLFYFARNLHDHIAAASANIGAAGAAPFLDRSVHYDDLTPAQAGALEAHAREAAMQVLLAVNRKALDLVEADRLPDDTGRQRVNVGTYIFVEREPPSRDEPGGGQPGPKAGAAS